MSGRTLRVLVTGSREFEWDRVVYAALARYRANLRPGDTLVVMHGKAKRGVDLFAHRWAAYQQNHPDPALADVVNDPHPADWYAPCRPECTQPGGHGRRRPAKRGGGRTWCPAQGNYRNQAMVDLGADRALIFMLDNSGGTMDCFGRIMTARIPWQAWGAYSLPENDADPEDRADRERAGRGAVPVG